MAPFTPTVKVEAAFGFAPFDDQPTWTNLSSFKPADVNINRGRPTELDRFKPATCSLRLLDTTRNLDPTNLSGTYVETITEQEYAVAAPSVSEVGTSLGSNNAQTLPTGVVVGDLLLAFVAVDNPGATTTVTGTGSAVWTTLFSTLSGSSEVRHTCFARIATGSDALVITGASQDYVCTIVRVVRHGCTTTSDIVVGTPSTAASGSIDPPSLAAGSVEKWLWIASGALDTTVGTTYSAAPSGFTLTGEVKFSDSTSTSGTALAVAYKEDQVTTLNPGTFTNASRAWVANTLAIPPYETSYDVSLVAPNTPLRITAVLPDRETVFSDPCTGPGLHSGWKIKAGNLTDPLSGTMAIPSGTQLEGLMFNFTNDALFAFGVPDGGSSGQDWAVEVLINGEGSMGFRRSGADLLVCVEFENVVYSDTFTWNSTDHRYLRLTTVGSNLVFQRSADNSSWTTLATYVPVTDFPAAADWSAGKLCLRNSGSTDIELDDFLVQVSQFTRFVGTVDQWDYQPLGGNQGAIVRVSAADNLKILANTTLESIYGSVVKESVPDVWYRLGEKTGQIAYDSSGNGRHANIPLNTLTQGASLGLIGLGAGAVEFPNKSIKPGLVLPDSARRTSIPYAVNLWIKTSDILPNQGLLSLGNRGPWYVHHQSELLADGYALVMYMALSGIDETDPSNPVITGWDLVVLGYEPGSSSGMQGIVCTFDNDGLPHMITLNVDSTGAKELFIDGAPGANPRYFYSGVIGAIGTTGHYIGRGEGTWNVFSVTPSYSFPGVIDELAMYTRTLSAAELQEMYLAGFRPWDRDTTGSRIERVLDLVGWPTHLRSIDVGQTVLAPADVEGSSALGHLQGVEATEGGRLFVGMNGELVFHGAERTLDRTTEVVTFDDAGAGVNILGEGFQLTQDDSKLYTVASVTRKGGDAQIYESTEAVARYGVRDTSLSGLLMTSDLEAYMRAVSLVERYKRPQPRLEEFEIAPEKDPTDWPTVLNLRLGDSFQATFTLLGSGDTFDSNFSLDSLKERIQDGAWTLALQGGPEDPNYGLYFQWDASADVGFDYGMWQ